MRRVAVAVLLVLAPVAVAQDTPSPDEQNATYDEDNLAGGESVAGPPEMVYYVVVAAISLTLFGGLFWASWRYARRRGSSRPPP